MKERISDVPSVQETKIYQNPTLRESLVGKKGKLSKPLTRVARMINYLDLTITEKRQLFFYHLWYDAGSFGQIKDFTELKEDPFNQIVAPVLADNRLVDAYSHFSKRFESKNPRMTFTDKLEELRPLRGKHTAQEIANITGYTKSYVVSVFKRGIKEGLLRPLGKRKSSKLSESYSPYSRLYKEVLLMRATTRYSDKQIAEILSKKWAKNITAQQVKRQIRNLLRDGKIERRINQSK